MIQTYIDRFFSKVEKTDTCWIWKSATNQFGHGMFSFQGKGIGAHRFSALIAGHDINGYFVCHKCDNPSCVNPDHLFVGTAKDNVNDMDQKGRRAKGYKRTKGIGLAKKKIQTPFGIFSSRKDAAQHLKITPPSLGDRMKRYPSEYYYI